LYPVPTTPAGKLVVVKANGGLTTICILALALFGVGVEESVTVTVKLSVAGARFAAVRVRWVAASGTVGVPEMRPVELFRVKPDGKLPDVIAHVYGGVPLFACKVAEYEEPATAVGSELTVTTLSGVGVEAPHATKRETSTITKNAEI